MLPFASFVAIPATLARHSPAVTATDATRIRDQLVPPAATTAGQRGAAVFMYCYKLPRLSSLARDLDQLGFCVRKA